VHAHGGRMAHLYGVGVERQGLLDAETETRLRLLAELKRRLDPAGILNPGVLG
jgi:FAD/FMN-containing dehydrogenase